jgi:hypothetical protein
MAFVGTAIAGSALIGAGASIYGGMQQASAAKGAAAAQQDSLALATQTSIAGGRDALAYLDPFRQYGLNAGSSLQAALYSPQQRQQQMTDQRNQLLGEVNRLKALAPKWDTYQVLTGPNASERRASMFTQENQIAQQKIAEAQSKLATFDKQAASQPAQGPSIQASPWYQFQSDLLNRSMDRSMAAQGLTGSGAALEERRMGLLQLGAQETENQFNRLAHIYDVGATAAAQGAGAITGTAQAVSNNQIATGQAQAQGILGVAGANRDMAYGIANSVTGAVGMGLQQNQWNMFRDSLNARNSGYDPVMGTGYGTRPSTMADATARNTASLNYLQPVP